MSVSSLHVEEGESGMDEKKDSRLTVLVVEDFEDNRFMMRRLLEMSGYRVVEAVNGQQAGETARAPRNHPEGLEPADARRAGGHATHTRAGRTLESSHRRCLGARLRGIP